MTTTLHPRAWKVLLAFATIYFVWGSTFLAIRVGVRDVPPFLLAGVRVLIAGAILFAWTRARGTSSPKLREWGAAVLVAILIFVLNYGLVFWAEQRVPSGVTAVMMATIPGFMALGEIVILRTRRFTARLGLALLVGIAGVAVLTGFFPPKIFPGAHAPATSSLIQQSSHGSSPGGNRLTQNSPATPRPPGNPPGEAPIDRTGACALIVAAICWSLASSLTRKVPLPSSKAMSSAAQMLAGGPLLLVVSALLGEFHGFHPRAVSRGAWLALAYLIVAGSIVAYTAYVWLLHHESPTKVGTYAYVNPVVAVALGYFLGGEAIGPRTIAGTLLVLASVVLITTIPAKQSQVLPARDADQLAQASIEV